MLYLGQPKVTDTGLAHLKEATQLRVLNIRGTMGTDASFAALKESLRSTNNGLTHPCEIIK